MVMSNLRSRWLSRQGVACCVAMGGLFLVNSVHAQKTIDPGDDCWTTPDRCDGSTSVEFGSSDLPEIPPDFFWPGSEAFSGQVVLKGANSGATDTKVRRLDQLVLPESGLCVTTDTEILQLDLVSCEPITVTVSGNPEDWDVAVDLSSVSAPDGTLGACKHDTDGGTIAVSILNVQPKFVFTKVGDAGEVRTYDTADNGVDPITISSSQEGHFLGGAAASDSPCDPDNFYAGARLVGGEVCCEEICHANGDGDYRHCIIPPDCPVCTDSIPTVSEWGLIAMAVLALGFGVVVLRRSQRQAA